MTQTRSSALLPARSMGPMMRRRNGDFVKDLIMATTWTQAILSFIACSAVAGLWAVFRPDLVRDNDGRRLPYSITARVSFTVLFIFAYLALAAGFLFGGFFVMSISQLVGPVPRFVPCV